MRNSVLTLLALVFLSISSSCSGPSAGVAPTNIPTQISAPRSTSTPLPSPTNTSEPSPPPIVYPPALDQIFSNIRIHSRDDFKYELQGRIPDGWVSANDNAALREIKGDYFRIDPRPNSQGDLFYFKQESIDPGEGVFFSFQYTGTKNTFTWGFDNVNAQGQFFKFKTEGYYSFAMQMLGESLSAHVIEGPYLKDDDFKGDLVLREDTWYDLTIAYDKNHNYIIMIWETDSPGNQLVYTRNWPNSPNTYYFISWIGAERSLWMDDFTVFAFDDLIQ